MTNPDFDPSLVKNASKACEGLCKWVRALDVYDRVVKIVAPKKLKLAEAEAELAMQMQKLDTKRKQLQDVTIQCYFYGCMWCGPFIITVKSTLKSTRQDDGDS